MCVRGVCPCVCARVCHWLCSTTSRHARCVISLKPTNKPSPLRRILTVCRWLPFNGTLRLASSLPRLPPSCARVRVRVCFNTTKRRRLALPCDPMRGYRCFLHPPLPLSPRICLISFRPVPGICYGVHFRLWDRRTGPCLWRRPRFRGRRRLRLCVELSAAPPRPGRPFVKAIKKEGRGGRGLTRSAKPRWLWAPGLLRGMIADTISLFPPTPFSLQGVLMGTLTAVFLSCFLFALRLSWIESCACCQRPKVWVFKRSAGCCREGLRLRQESAA